ncbi:DUF6193 family natural product biosynthesis protein [Nonomuraea indica]|uniref:DUF6193 family natural product biosynthesis protein n=1 Tax=Nonomuraea indica TaxID=1581193 RepID=UPI0011822D9C|nr:DUF6193 family natural product biosynthesis protein [Nonomuraea indica]
MTTPDPADLYPDVAAIGSLAAALQKAAIEHGFELGAVAANEREPLLYARVPSTTPLRDALEVHAGHIERYWSISGWGRGIELVSGTAQELSEVAKAAREWRDGTPLRGIQRSTPFVELCRLAEAAEQGPTQTVSEQWLWMRQDAEEAPWPEYRALIEAANAEPQLRQLFPYTSHWSLRLSAIAGFRFSADVLCLEAHRGSGYVVKASWQGAVLGETTTAQEAVSLAVGHLPTDIGPAVAGTREDYR